RHPGEHPRRLPHGGAFCAGSSATGAGTARRVPQRRLRRQPGTGAPGPFRRAYLPRRSLAVSVTAFPAGLPLGVRTMEKSSTFWVISAGKRVTGNDLSGSILEAPAARFMLDDGPAWVYASRKSHAGWGTVRSKAAVRLHGGNLPPGTNFFLEA